MTLYEVEYNDHRWIKIEKDDSYNVVFKIPYSSVKEGIDCPDIENRFIVYILQGISANSKDHIYVGKSTKGLDTRPASHESKYDDWTYCYVLTRNDSKFFNDGVIQYLEDTIRHRVDDCSDTFINTTNKTSSNTANERDIQKSKKYLEDVYERLFILGLDLNLPKQITIEDYVREGSKKKTIQKEKEKDTQQVDFFYLVGPKVGANAKAIIMEDKSVKVLSGSIISYEISESFTTHNYARLRDELISNGIIVKRRFVSDYVFSSLSAAAAVLLGRSAAGPIKWKNADNKTYKDLHPEE